MRVIPIDGYTEPHGKPSASCLTPKLASSASVASLGASQMELAMPFIERVEGHLHPVEAYFQDSLVYI